MKVLSRHRATEQPLFEALRVSVPVHPRLNLDVDDPGPIPSNPERPTQLVGDETSRIAHPSDPMGTAIRSTSAAAPANGEGLEGTGQLR